MNPISAFFVRNIIVVFFFYGLAFFVMGLALALASQRASEFRFAQAIRPLAAFGILHGVHEWVEMYQKVAALTSGYTPNVAEEAVRVTLLALSLLMLLAFGILLLLPADASWRRVIAPVVGMAALWLAGSVAAAVTLRPTPYDALAMADVLARYSLGIPGALLGTWALMTQQRTFREHDMPQFGRDLIWCATALLLFGVIGQAFVRPTPLVPSNIINSTLFLHWFGVPIQLFRAVMAAALAFFMVRALNAFEVESRRALERANQARLQTQALALATERLNRQEMERLNAALNLTAHELALLLEVSNLLAAPRGLDERLRSVLDTVVSRLGFADEGLILLVVQDAATPQVWSSNGMQGAAYADAVALGEACIREGKAVCRHEDGTVIAFTADDSAERRECQTHASPITMISLPLTARQRVIGSIVLSRSESGGDATISAEGYRLMLGTAQQMGLSIENALLYQQAQAREKTLGELLHQAVGAQESERQRIARELHDATGQSLTAIALGLRGVEGMLGRDPAVAANQLKAVTSFTTDALGELRRIIADLRPSQLDDLGLVAALQWYAQEFERRYRLQADFTVQGKPLRLPPEYEIVLFRIAQEALTNVAKHAQATRVSVALDFTSAQVAVTVQDDGQGFDATPSQADDARPHWGLLGMQERAALLGGQCAITSTPGQGTTVTVTVPLPTETTDGE